MPPTLPDPETDYAAPQVLELSRVIWNHVMLSLSTRLKALEGTTADYLAAIAQLETQALAVITATITAEINAQRINLDQLSADTDAAQAQLTSLLASGLDAAMVFVAPITGLTATTGQAAIAELLAKINANDAIIPRKATIAEVRAGTDPNKYITPETLSKANSGVATMMKFGGVSFNG